MPALPTNVSEVVRYKDVLDAAWADHMRPRDPDAPTVVSTFAGCGGSSLGYSMAGYSERLVVERDKHAVATFRQNFPGVPVYDGDICGLASADALQLSGLTPGELTVLDGSPPCQGFSTAGERKMEDPRNGLFREYVRLLEAFQPKAFVMENVSGMVKGKMRLIFRDIMQALKACGPGYDVSARLLKAQYFGVPQARERIIFVGMRSDLGIAASHPTAQTRVRSVAQAWHGVQISDAQRAECTYPSKNKVFALLQLMKPGESGSKYAGNGSYFQLWRCHWDRPARTISAAASFGRTASSMCHPVEHRRLTAPELKRLCSFPDQFLISGKITEICARFGNSVPPFMMRAIAEHIRAELTRANVLAA
jgi:DNA (cytosine-5)-methyltransferase 1